MYLPYAGIGSRETPVEVCHRMVAIAHRLEELGFTLRSGHADGADLACERGVLDPRKKEIFLPWAGFNYAKGGAEAGYYWSFPTPELEQRAQFIAQRMHPNWGACSQGARKLHTRNVAQVLGRNVDEQEKSLFILCWTIRGSGQGGTGQALRMARAYGIPIFDLGLPDMTSVLNDLGVLVKSICEQ